MQGLAPFWTETDAIGRLVVALLLAMSVSAWVLIVWKGWVLPRARRDIDRAVPAFWAADTLDAGRHHEGALTEHIDRNTWVAMSVQRAVETVQSRLQDGLAFLATVASSSPFVGLFGTVWGIYHALTAIGIAGQASIDKVAGPVGEALIMTAIGLAVAVPAVLGYNWLVRRNKVAMESVRGFAADLHGVLMGHRAEPPAAPGAAR